jgi:LacI family transcriptional regulator
MARKKKWRLALGLQRITALHRHMMEGASACARERDSIEFATHWGDPSRVYAKLAEVEADALIGHLVDPSLLEAYQARFSLVINVSNITPHFGEIRITNDDEQIGRLGAEHFLERGFKSFAFFGFQGHHYSDRRCLGFAARLAEAGFEPKKLETNNELTPEDWDAHLQALGDWLQPLPKPIGLLVCNDEASFRFFDLAKRVGLNIPRDLAVLGVDNETMINRLLSPPLSSVAPNGWQIGFHACEYADRILSGEDRPGAPLLVPPLRVETRESTDVLAISDEVVREALAAMNAHLELPSAMERVVEGLPVSRRTLEIRFKKALGQTPYAELLRLRLERAKRLLLQPGLSGEQVAEASGFSSAKELWVAFKRRFGQTPGAFRELHQRR